MKKNKLFNALTGGLILGSLLIAFSGCYGNRVLCTPPCPIMDPCAPCAPYGPDCKPCAVLDCCDFRMEKVSPNSVGINCPFDTITTFCAKTDLKDVTFSDKIPEGAEYISSNPQAKMAGNTLTWNYDRLAEGEMVQVCVTYRATVCGCLKDCLCASATPCACTVICVGQPILEIEKCGPEEICISPECPDMGECATFNISVRNVGNFRAENVVITDVVPEGMVHASGKRELRLDVGCLEPGESTSANITLQPTRCGCFCNVARVTQACDNRVCEASACVRVLCPKVGITKTGCPMQYIEHCGECPVAPYTITVSNLGDMPLTNVIVSDYVAEGNYIVDAGGGSVNCNIINWNIPCLNCGETQSFCIALRATCPGCYVNQAMVTANDCRCPVSACASFQTEWRGHPAMCIELCDECDPLFIGSETVYRIRIVNQGTAADTNVKVVGWLPEQMEFISANGPVAFQVSGKSVAFDCIPCLAPQESIGFCVRVRGVIPGDGRFKLQVSSDTICNPLNEEESTHVLQRPCY